jgi:hypothetical protein
MLRLWLLCWTAGLLSSSFIHRAPATFPAQSNLSRDQIIATAERLARHTWVCREANRRAPCVTTSPYQSDWDAGQTVTGIAYDWGGMDDPEAFDRKLAQGQAAGSHSRHGVTSCTAGIDCSGFVSYCWGQRPTHDYSTRNIRDIAGRPRYNWFSDMKPGDALNKPGDHIVLFAGYRADGNPIVYEASGSAGRVIRNDWSTWSRFKSYYPLQYQAVAE